MKNDIKHIDKGIQKELDEKRYVHTLGVAYTAAALAMRFGEDIKKAQIAGLLHDIAKQIDDAKKISMCEKRGLTVSDVERSNPGLLHAKLGAELAVEKFEINDEDIINAIRNHTTGRPGMSLLEKIVFVADYIEPNRKDAPNLDEIRRVTFENIDLGMHMILKDTLTYLKETGKPIDDMTFNTFKYHEFYLKKNRIWGEDNE